MQRGIGDDFISDQSYNGDDPAGGDVGSPGQNHLWRGNVFFQVVPLLRRNPSEEIKQGDSIFSGQGPQYYLSAIP
jgi:hypothetical protein